MVLNSQSFRERQLLTEFALFRTTPLPGIYLSLHPSTPTIWYGVIFLRSSKDIYGNIPIRFSITFGNKYPDVPPFVVLHSSSGSTNSEGGAENRNGSTNSSGGEILLHPLVSRGGSSSGRGLSAGYAGVHTGAVNLRDCYGGWFEPKNIQIPVAAPSTPIKGNTSGVTAGSASTKPATAGTTGFPAGASPVEVIYYLRSIFTDKYLLNLQNRLDSRDSESEGKVDEASLILDDEAWKLWRDNREELRRRVEKLREDWYEGGKVFGEWEGGGDVPIRFLDLQREALDTIKENVGRRVVGGR
ncbi:hypothetical protein H072_446 [Dactylellina haptotyla CBS 200.50]|uniref:UBC core domain-containing protein n=1 Tax=Dactylellina haptotyla (strain CBS 200.50) TaxID=1284197 RepID=S8ARQ5_DACHA|nr:hypothetical protein H072_446 [Dactylellina haptotyla CBS 200.50]